jgi:predicted CopG family antitoxin
METKRLNVWVEADVYEQALAKARSEDLSLSQVIRRFLRQYVGVSTAATKGKEEELQIHETED